MRVLHVVRGMGNSSGTTHVVRPLAEAQARRGWDVSLLCVEKRGHEEVLPDPCLVRTRRFGLSLPFDNPGISLGFARAVQESVRAADCVHIHAVWNFPTWWTMRACLAEGRPYVVAPQGSFEPWALRLNRWGKLLYGAVAEVPLMARATRLQALTQNEADQIQTRLPGAAVTIVPNGVDVTAFEGPRVPLAKQLGLPAGTRTLLSLSRLHPKKGIDRLIEGLAGVARRLPGLAVVVAGHDAGTGYGETLRRRAAELGVSDRCHFIGERSGRDKAHVLLGADAFALISHSEGLPVAVLEALASGRAVIISRSCNLPEVAAHGAGVEVSGEPETVAAAIWDVCSDPQVAGTMGERGRVLARTRFAWERIAEQTLALYEACIAEGRNAAATTVSPL